MCSTVESTLIQVRDHSINYENTKIIDQKKRNDFFWNLFLWNEMSIIHTKSKWHTSLLKMTLIPWSKIRILRNYDGIHQGVLPTSKIFGLVMNAYFFSTVMFIWKTVVIGVTAILTSSGTIFHIWKKINILAGILEHQIAGPSFIKQNLTREL